MYYQFVIRTMGYEPMTMKTKYRVYERAEKMLKKYIKDGYTGCMCIFHKGEDNNYNLIRTREF